jgi:hypothetical protein
MIRAIATALDGANCDIAMNSVLAAQQRSSSLAAAGACNVTVRHTPSIRPRLDAISWPPVE